MKDATGEDCVRKSAMPVDDRNSEPAGQGLERPVRKVLAEHLDETADIEYSWRSPGCPAASAFRLEYGEVESKRVPDEDGRTQPGRKGLEGGGEVGSTCHILVPDPMNKGCTFGDRNVGLYQCRVGVIQVKIAARKTNCSDFDHAVLCGIQPGGFRIERDRRQRSERQGRCAVRGLRKAHSTRPSVSRNCTVCLRRPVCGIVLARHASGNGSSW